MFRSCKTVMFAGAFATMFGAPASSHAADNYYDIPFSIGGIGTNCSGENPLDSSEALTRSSQKTVHVTTLCAGTMPGKTSFYVVVSPSRISDVITALIDNYAMDGTKKLPYVFAAPDPKFYSEMPLIDLTLVGGIRGKIPSETLTTKDGKPVTVYYPIFDINGPYRNHTAFAFLDHPTQKGKTIYIVFFNDTVEDFGRGKTNVPLVSAVHSLISSFDFTSPSV